MRNETTFSLLSALYSVPCAVCSALYKETRPRQTGPISGSGFGFQGHFDDISVLVTVTFG